MATMKGIPLSKVSPAFLHANSTSHTWVFSAFAELIDNAYDPDVSASELLIDKVDIRGTPCLIFLDNGAGMDAGHLLKMLSFGFCEKDIYEKQGSHQPIGHYGNGFKSGSMRIGHDALVFTRCPKSASIGFLSQTYLTSIQADSVMVPILEYRLPKLERIKSQESRNNLNAILEYSVFKAESELKEELKALEGSKTGTKIIIYNLKRLQDSTYELDFSSDPTDIRCPEAHEVDTTSVYHRPIQQNASEYKRSLREYCSILFLRPRMKITIRGVRVKSKLIAKSLSNTEIDMYKPTWLSRPVKIIFGFVCDTQRPEDVDYGMMLYHRNRLIKAFEKVGYQRQPNDLGVGVVGVAQVDFLQPIHNKQDFNKDEKFNSVMSAFANKLNDYWNEKKGSDGTSQPAVRNLPDWLWAQCEHCLKWRRLPDEIDSSSLPEQWFCRMNPDATHNRCDIPEEPEDEDLAVKPTYEKTFKKKQEERKRVLQLEKEKEENLKRRKIMEKEQELKEKEAALRAIQQVAAAQPLQENRAVVSLQKALAEARRREEQQKRLILQIQEQKKAMEVQRNSLLQLAETLQGAQENNTDEVIEQMSQFINTLGPGFASPKSGTPSGKGKVEDTQPTLSGRRKRKANLKTELDQGPSVNEHDIEVDVDEDFSMDDIHPGKSVNGTAISPVKSEVSSRQPKQRQTSSGVTKVARNPATKSSKQPTPVAVETLTDAKAVSASPASTATSKQKRQRKNTVVDVIDLTDESQVCDLVDVKPSLLEHDTTSLSDDPDLILDIKPDKGALDKVLTTKDDKDTKDAVELALKQELGETATENLTLPQEGLNSLKKDDTVSVTTVDNESGIRFGPREEPEFKMGEPEFLQDNLDAAIAAIQDRMQKEKSQQETGDCQTEIGEQEAAVKDEFRDENNQNTSGEVGGGEDTVVELKEGIMGYTDELDEPQGVHGAERRRSGYHDRSSEENEQRSSPLTLSSEGNQSPMLTLSSEGNQSPVLTLSDLLPVEDNVNNCTSDTLANDKNDYEDCSIVDDDDDGDDGCGDNNDGCGVGDDNDDGNGGGCESSNYGDANSIGQRIMESPHVNTSEPEMPSEVTDRFDKESESVTCSNKLYDLVDAGLSCSSAMTKDGAECSSKTTDKTVNFADCLQHEQEKILVSSEKTLSENISPSSSNSESLCEDITLLQPENHKPPHFKSSTADGSLRVGIDLDEASTGSDSPAIVDDDVCEELKGERAEDHVEVKDEPESVQDSELTSTQIWNHSAVGKSVISEESTCSTGEDDCGITNHINQKVDKCNGEGKCQRERETELNYFQESQCKSKQMCDQHTQTNIDMMSLKCIFSQNDISGIKTVKPANVRNSSTSMEKCDKSSQVTNLATDFQEVSKKYLCKNSQIDIVKDLKQEIASKTELTRKMEDRLAESYVNIHKLLGFIVPSAELGDVENIHQVIKDMVRYSESSPHPALKGTGNTS